MIVEMMKRCLVGQTSVGEAHYGRLCVEAPLLPSKLSRKTTSVNPVHQNIPEIDSISNNNDYGKVETLMGTKGDG